VRDLPILLRHMSVEFFAGGLVHFFRIRIVLCLISGFMYLVSPLDVIPEAIYGLFGFLDDIVVLLAIAVYLTVVYRGVLAGRWADESF
jgi:RING finger protein 170